MAYDRIKALRKRRLRVRRKVRGTAERPRLSVNKSLKHLYVQVIDDKAGRTLAFATTNTKANRAAGKSFCNVKTAGVLGTELGKKALEKGVKAVVFDRGGNRYHGILKAFADAAREAGLSF